MHTDIHFFYPDCASGTVKYVDGYCFSVCDSYIGG
jgi:hypothetical protein